MRRNLWIPDPLWDRVVAAAVKATGEEGKPIGRSEIVRRAIEAYLDQQPTQGAGR
ncbi:MAG: hypothetical protein NUW01_13415 [Gemmatimonadaceae bacterium]|nr:hypothetical protein [Gemmatimonadaceae bacterium]